MRLPRFKFSHIEGGENWYDTKTKVYVSECGNFKLEYFYRAKWAYDDGRREGRFWILWFKDNTNEWFGNSYPTKKLVLKALKKVVWK